MTARRFRDIVAWDTLVAPGVVTCKDGALLGAWQVAGIDTGRVSPAEQQALRCELARGLSSLKGGETLWAIWQRRPWTPVPLLDDTGDDALASLAIETNTILSDPEQVWEDDLTLWFHARAQGDLASALEIFEARRRLVEGWLDPVLGLSRVDGGTPKGSRQPAEIVSRLADLAGTPRLEPRLADLPVALDAVMAPDLRQPHRNGPVLRQGQPLAVITLTGEREDYAAAPLEPLQNLKMAFTWVTRYRAFSRAEARDALAWRKKLLGQSAADLLANIEGSGTGDRSLYGDRLLAETEITREVIERGEEGHGSWLSVLLIQGGPDDPLAPRIQTLREAVQQTGFVFRQEDAGAVPTYFAALPGHAAPVARDVMVRAQIMADCSPLRGTFSGPAYCPSSLLPPETPPLLPALTPAGTLHHVHLHVDDVGHTLVFGPTGTGKSVLLGHLAAAWLRYPEAQVIAFDRGRSLRYATAALGGLWLEPGGTGAGLAPLAHIERLGADWARSWVQEMARRGLDRPCTPEEARELDRALEHLAPGPAPGLETLRDQVQDKALRQVLDTWITGPRAGTFGQNAAVLDVGTALTQTALTVFETEPLIDAEEDITVLALDYVFAEVEGRFDGRPTLIVIDEAWKLLDHARFAERLRSWLREGRKKNVAVLMATQSVSDAARAAITADLVESCATRMYLANPMATTQVPDYRALGLTPDRINTVARLQRKREMMVVQAACARVLSMPLGPHTLSILGRTTTTESARVAERAARNPRFWVDDLAALTLAPGP